MIFIVGGFFIRLLLLLILLLLLLLLPSMKAARHQGLVNLHDYAASQRTWETSESEERTTIVQSRFKIGPLFQPPQLYG